MLKDVDRMLQKRDTRSANPATAFEPRICTFSNSQWHVKAELGNGRWQESSFYLSLISPDCKGTAMIIDELVQPLQRIPGVLVSDVFDFSGIHLWYPVVPFVFFFQSFRALSHIPGFGVYSRSTKPFACRAMGARRVSSCAHPLASCKRATQVQMWPWPWLERVSVSLNMFCFLAKYVVVSFYPLNFLLFILNNCIVE